MKRLRIFLVTSGIIFPLVLMVASLITNDTQANPLKQDSCEAACACEGFTPEQVRGQYEKRTLAPDSYFTYIYDSKCAEMYGDQLWGGVEPMADILRKAGYFLDDMAKKCQKCRGESAPAVKATDTPEPSIFLQPVEPAQKPPVAATPTPSPTPELPFPEILVEIEKMNTGAPYIGVVADGKSYLDIHITNKDAARQVMVSFDISAGSSMREGRLIASDGSDLQKGAIVLPPGTKSTLRYIPPAQLEMTGNSRSWAIGGKNRKITGYITEIPFVFQCQDCQESTSQVVEFYILQPPVQMVHGYLGSEGTWKNMAAYLSGKNLDAVPGTYNPPPPDSWIQVMAATLGDDIENLLTEYREQGIKIERVDIVCHSMGGLISRWYIDNNLGEGVRKLVMLATPNHGVDDWHRVTRVIASGWSGSHLFSGAQLNADSNFFAELNTYEVEMNHLIPSVEYANIIGRASCGRFCPDDAVVPIASAHLNGVVEYIYDGTIHSSDLRIDKWPDRVNPWFSKSDVGIADSAAVMEKVLGLLTHPIPRANPDFAWSMVLQEVSGEVYVIGEDRQLIRAENYPLRLKNGSNIRTGGTGKAVIILYLNGEEQKRIGLSGYSDIVFGVSSPDTLTTILLDGSGKFTTTHTTKGEIKNSQFDVAWVVAGYPPEIKLHNHLRDLETEFVLTAGNQANLIVLDGSILVDTFDADGAPVSAGQVIRAETKKAVYIDPNGNLQESDVPGGKWWKDEFFGKKYPVPDFVAAERRDPSNLNVSESASPFTSKNDSVLAEPGLYLLGAGLCTGVLILVIFVVIIFLRRRSPAAGSLALHKDGWMGVSGWLLAVGIAGLAFACLASIAGILWWQGLIDLPSGKTVMDKPGGEFGQQIFVAQPVIEPPPAPVPITLPLPGAPDSSGSLPNSQPMVNNLSAYGPWIVYSSENGLWAVNEDGSGLTQLVADAYLGPADLQAAISPDGARMAFITASDPAFPQDPMLFILSLPDVKLQGMIELTIPENAPMPGAAVCDPRLEAVRASTIGNGLDWSPDGSQLAFTAALEGETADVYLYSFDDGSIQRLTDEPGQAYDLHWSAEENKIVYFSANCFGSGGGFDMEGVYTVDPDAGGQKLIYRPDEQSYGEEFAGWLFTDRTKFMAATISGCPYRDMRLVDMQTGEGQMLYEGCFEDYAVGPTSMLAVLTSRDMSNRPGVYLFPEPEYGFEALYFPNENGRRIEFDPGLMGFLVQNHEQGYKEIVSVDLDGEESWYLQRGELPAFSKDGEYWVWEDQGKFYLGGNNIDAPVELLDQPGQYPLWSEVFSGGDILQQVIFTGSTPPFRLYQLIPGYDMKNVGEGVNPVAAPVVVYP